MHSLTDFEKQRELLLTGDYYNLFNNLKLNLPQRFFEYTNPNAVNDKFHSIFKELNAARKNINKNDAWCFNDVIKIIAPMYKSENLLGTVYFLKDKCGVTEEHIIIKKHITKDTFLPTDQIFLSSYALILLCNRLLKENNSFKNDISEPLFVKSKKRISPDFISEMRLVFAGYFFAFNGSDDEEIIKAVWNWVRGIRLKNSYNETMKDLSFILRNIMGQKFNYHNLEEFKQKFILNVLFSGNFIEKYETFLTSCGYEKKFDKNQIIKWHKGKNTAPKYPGAFFAPHIDFLLSWSIQAFCKFAKKELANNQEKNQIKVLEKLAQNFFTTVNLGYTDATNSTDVKSAPIFINQHNSDARKTTKEIKFGKGKKTTNSLTGEKTKESPGALEFYKTKTLLSFDDNWCLEARRNAEKKLLSLHNEFKVSPSKNLSDEIFKAENEIKQENEAVYGVNLNTFVCVPEILTQSGEFIPRHKNNDHEQIIKIESEKSDIKTSSPVKIQYNLFDDLSPESIFKNFTAIRQTSETFHKFTPNGNGWVHDNRGVYECINEFIQEQPGDLWKTQKNEVSKTGRTRLNCKLKYMMFEWDHLPLITQWQKVQENINVICQATYSGNKSIHIKIASADEPKTMEEYDWLREHILIKLGFVDSDPNVKDNSRTSRVPGVINPSTGRMQQLLHFNNNARFVEDWRPLFTTEKAKKAAIKNNFTVHYDKNDKLKDYWIKRIIEVRNGLEEGNQTETLKSIINTASCAILSKEEFESLLKDYLTKDHHRDIASLYEYRRQRM